MPEKRTSPRAPALFVYGSLMQRKYWRSVVGAKAAAVIRIAPARLRGWKRWWNGVRPSYGGAVLNLKRDSECHLWGGVVEGLSEEACARLDEQERSHLPSAQLAFNNPTVILWEDVGLWIRILAGRWPMLRESIFPGQR